MSIYAIVDTIYVGHFVGPEGIGAITVVLPITFLISSIGMAIGVGGSSVLSRALGDKNHPKAFKTFGNQVMMTISLAIFFVMIGSLDRKSTRLNSSHVRISYAVFCLKKKKNLKPVTAAML